MAAFTEKTWKDRIAQYLNRRKLIDIDTGDEHRVNVLRDEGDVTEAGDPYTAANMNDLEARIKAAFDAMHPVGSIYMSVDNTNPSSLFGGTWVEWGAGKVPVGVDSGDTDFDTVEETGGAKTVTLTAAQSGVPAHAHTTPNTNFQFNKSTISDTSYGLTANGAFNGDVIVVQNTGTRTSGTNQPIYNSPATNNNTAAAASQAHTNLQPYITCYMWKRVS